MTFSPPPEPAGLPDLPPPPPPPAPAPAPRHAWSLGLAVVSGMALGLAGLAALALFGAGLLGGGGGPLDVNAQAVLVYAWMALIVALLQIPALVYSIARLKGRALDLGPASGPWFAITSVLMFIFWPLLLLGGPLFAGLWGAAAPVVLGLLQVGGIGIPLAWLVLLARRGLPAGRAQRAWGVASVSTAFTMPFILVVELLGLVLLIFGAIFFLALQPGMASRLQDLASSMRPGALDPQELSRFFDATISQPQLIFVILGLAAVVVPLLEEMLKPLACWFLARPTFSAAEGFSAGVVAGACFALLESFSAVSGSSLTVGSGWAGMVALRAGTGLMHIACSGLVGWGLAEAWHGARYLRLAGLYLLAAGIHGAWNALAVLQGLGESFSAGEMGIFEGLSRFSVPGMVLLLVLAFGILFFGNRYLRQHAEANP